MFLNAQTEHTRTEAGSNCWVFYFGALTEVEPPCPGVQARRPGRCSARRPGWTGPCQVVSSPEEARKAAWAWGENEEEEEGR